jgi:hypothetical protein
LLKGTLIKLKNIFLPPVPPVSSVPPVPPVSSIPPVHPVPPISSVHPVPPVSSVVPVKNKNNLYKLFLQGLVFDLIDLLSHILFLCCVLFIFDF